ncbi:FAD:protein FMN transferase [Leucobacter insecticola]|uniref:FAD:protein FMN transferase n=1 Tax=Leucobacter insecticola TaxID=2714934 RepID=A0A6G8FIU8_9MICO|nr:FAD:protein FMN transferase [Leucobacter insecticola]QIM16297.1 FAD:protein FMN transferase [Leucobacter insecticola]
MTHEAQRKAAATAEIMGTMVSVQVIGADQADPDVSAAISDCFAQLRDVDRVFSPYRADSDVCRIQRGELDIVSADPRMAEVVDACARAEVQTRGRFSANWRGTFDPTGYVKGWAVEQAQRLCLLPLLETGKAIAVALNAGGDMQLSTAADASWEWRIGIADPRRAGHLVSTLEIRNGAIATSGPAERGTHIVDPRTGGSARGVASATVVARSLADADVWATAAVVAGMQDLSWLQAAGQTNGLIVGDDGSFRRWAHGVELTQAADLTAGAETDSYRMTWPAA